MPRGDRRGPMGEGPRTGGGYGDCPDDQPGTMHAAPGMGYGAGMGWRRGWGRGARWPGGVMGRRRRFVGRGFGPTPWDMGWGPPIREPTPDVEVTDLKAQASWLQEQLDMVQARMDELNGRTDEV